MCCCQINIWVWELGSVTDEFPETGTGIPSVISAYYRDRFEPVPVRAQSLMDARMTTWLSSILNRSGEIWHCDTHAGHGLALCTDCRDLLCWTLPRKDVWSLSGVLLLFVKQGGLLVSNIILLYFVIHHSSSQANSLKFTSHWSWVNYSDKWMNYWNILQVTLSCHTHLFSYFTSCTAVLQWCKQYKISP